MISISPLILYFLRKPQNPQNWMLNDAMPLPSDKCHAMPLQKKKWALVFFFFLIFCANSLMLKFFLPLSNSGFEKTFSCPLKKVIKILKKSWLKKWPRFVATWKWTPLSWMNRRMSGVCFLLSSGPKLRMDCTRLCWRKMKKWVFLCILILYGNLVFFCKRKNSRIC